MTTPEAPKEQPKGWMNKVLTSGKIAGAIVGVFALLALFGIKPPKLIQDPTPTSARLSATLSDLSIEYDIPFDEYVTRHGWSLDTYSDDQQQAVGAIVDFKSEITGFADQWCALKWGIYDAATQKRILVSTQDLEILIKSERETDKASDFIWVAYPDTAGTYFARIEIFDPNGQRLDFADTELFDLTIDD
jgi:hypothetical protein